MGWIFIFLLKAWFSCSLALYSSLNYYWSELCDKLAKKQFTWCKHTLYNCTNIRLNVLLFWTLSGASDDWENMLFVWHFGQSLTISCQIRASREAARIIDCRQTFKVCWQPSAPPLFTRSGSPGLNQLCLGTVHPSWLTELDVHSNCCEVIGRALRHYRPLCFTDYNCKELVRVSKDHLGFFQFMLTGLKALPLTRVWGENYDKDCAEHQKQFCKRHLRLHFISRMKGKSIYFIFLKRLIYIKIVFKNV